MNRYKNIHGTGIRSNLQYFEKFILYYIVKKDIVKGNRTYSRTRLSKQEL